MMVVQRPSLRGSGGPGPSLIFLLQFPAPKALSVCTSPSNTHTNSASFTVCFISYLLCPLLLTGAAIRHCDIERGWLEPDLYNCTSPPFVDLNAAVRRFNQVTQQQTFTGVKANMKNVIICLHGVGWSPSYALNPFPFYLGKNPGP